MANVRFKGVQKAYGDVRILHGIDLEIRDGEFMVFVGPSGCGKSTLLRTIAGLEDITGGTLSIGDRVVNDVPPAERGIAMVFQSYALYPHMNLYDNMAFGLKLAKLPKEEIDRAVMHAARILHIEHLLQRKPKDLSGGQRQRVAIGRAIVKEPDVFLFDEPLSNLDAALRVQTRLEIAKLHHDIGTASMIYVTHDQVEAMTLADKIVLLRSGAAVQEQGSVAQFGSPMALYHRPENLFVAEFIGSPKMNILPATLLRAEADHAVVRVQGGEAAEITVAVDARRAKAGDAVSLGIRPEHLLHGSEASGAPLAASVRQMERLGEASMLYLDVAPGLPMVTLRLRADHCHLFDAAGQAFARSVQLPG